MVGAMNLLQANISNQPTKAILCIALLLLSACAAPVSKYKSASKAEIDAEIRLQKEMVYQAFRNEGNLLNNITFQILKANAEFCTEDAISYGFTFWNIDTISRVSKYREVAENLYKLDHVFQIDQIYTNTADQTANIKTGDKIIAINGVDVSSKAVKPKDIYKALSKTGAASPAKLLLLRDNTEVEIKTAPYSVCNYPLRYDYNDPIINAFANGRRIIMTRGFYQFAKDEEELAMALAHEVGHNIMRHIGKKRENEAMGKLANIILFNALKMTDFYLPSYVYEGIVDQSYLINSVDFEREADYLGIYFAERAGYDTSDSIALWRRMSVEVDAEGIDKRSTHPAKAERFVYLQKTLDEVAEKRRLGLPLIPEIDWDNTSEKDIYFKHPDRDTEEGAEEDAKKITQKNE
jgi:hypothetical protein